MGPYAQSATAAKNYYYEKDPVFNADGKGNNTRWLGGGCEALGLVNGIRIEGKDFLNVIEGKDLEGNQLVRLSYTDDKGRAEHRAGIDFTFDDPKDVAIIELVLGYKPEVFMEIRKDAINHVSKVLDEECLYYRETQNGFTKDVHIKGQGIMAVYHHGTSRENDPQPHTHLFISNMLRTPDGSYKAIEGKYIFAAQKYLTSVYHSFFASKLKELGFGIQPIGDGLYSLKGGKNEARELFSKRSETIKANEEALKASGAYKNAPDAELNLIAAFMDRPGKNTTITLPELKTLWDEQLKAHSFSADKILHDYNNSVNLSSSLKPGDYISLAVKDMLSSESTFTKYEILAAANSLSIGDCDDLVIASAFNKAVKSGSVVELGRDKKGYAVFSSPGMIETELNILDTLKAGKGTVEPIMSRDEAHSFIEKFQKENGYTLTDGQKDLFTEVMTTDNQFVLSQGNAGTGKTTVFKAVRQAVEGAGYSLEGYSKTGKAAHEFMSATGSFAQTVDGHVLQRETEGKNLSRENTIRVIDEASMLGSVQTLKEIEFAQRDGARIVMIGDIKQLQSLDAGRTFRDCQEKGEIDVVMLTESLRQKSVHTRMLVSAMADKNFERIENILSSHDMVSSVSDRNERLHLAKAEFFFKGGTDTNTHIITQINADRNELNAMIREELKLNGKLEEGVNMTVREHVNMQDSEKRYSHNFEAGGIIFPQSSLPGLRAGSEARITEVDHSENKLFCQTLNGKTVSIDLLSYGDRLQLYNEVEKNFSPGDSIIFTKNDCHYGLQNGNEGRIISIDDNGKVSVRMSNKSEISFTPEKHYPYIDHGYAITAHKSQGATYSNVIFAGEGERTNYNQFYVAASRCKDDFSVIVDDKDVLMKNMHEEEIKRSTLDHTYGRDESAQPADEKARQQSEAEISGKGFDKAGVLEHDFASQDKDRNTDRIIDSEYIHHRETRDGISSSVHGPVYMIKSFIERSDSQSMNESSSSEKATNESQVKYEIKSPDGEVNIQPPLPGMEM